MKTPVVLGCIASVAFMTSLSANAADLKMPVKAPPVVAAFSWTGCYVGGYAGGAWGDGATFTDQGQNGLGVAGSIANPPFQSYAGGAVAARLVPPHSWSSDFDPSFIGGGTVGCNWQPVGTRYVLGIEGEIGYLHLHGQAFDPATIISTQTTLDVLGNGRVGDWYGTVTGRLGYTWDRTLLYIKGGAAFIRTQSSVVDACQATAAGCGNWLISTGGSNTETTWTIGGGLEWAFASNWSLKGEYMFIALADRNGFQSCGPVTTPSGATLAGGPFCFNHSFGDVHTAKIGVNYRFTNF